MLETSEERVELLKEGIDGKEIEDIYVIVNGYQIIDCIPPISSD